MTYEYEYELYSYSCTPLCRFTPVLVHKREGTPISFSTMPRFSSDLTLEDVRQWQADFASARDWNQFHSPRNLVLALTGEVGELAECFQWKGDDKCGPGLPDWSEKDRAHLGQELSDVLFYLIRLSDRWCVRDFVFCCQQSYRVDGARVRARERLADVGKQTHPLN